MDGLPHLEIVLANPCECYYPGQIVAGRVVINLCADEEVRGVAIHLEGKATVCWTEDFDTDSDEEESEDDDGNVKLKVLDPVDNLVTYVDLKNVYKLAIDENDHVLQRGETSYSFKFKLPSTNLPCTFNGKYGRIEYFVKAILQRAYWKVDYETIKHIKINAVVDLNMNPEAALPGEWKTSKTFGYLCCVSSPLNMEVKLDRQGYVCGDEIRVQVDVDNLSTRRINNLTVKFIQQSKYVGQSSEKVFSKVLCTRKRGECIDAKESGSWSTEVMIPGGLPPSGLGGGDVIGVRYILKAVAHVFGVAINLKQDCQVIIGTVPLNSRREEQQQDEEGGTTVEEITQDSTNTEEIERSAKAAQNTENTENINRINVKEADKPDTDPLIL